MRWTIGIFAAFALCLTGSAQRVLSPILFGNSGAAAPTMTLKFQAHNNSCGGPATTCSVTLPQSLSNGDAVEVTGTFGTSGTAITSVNVGGTYNEAQCLTGTSFASTPWIDCGYILSATSTAGPLVFTLSQSNTGGEIDVRVWSVTGGTPVLDSANSINNSSASSLTFSGPSDTISCSPCGTQVGAVTNSAASMSSVASPYNTNANISVGDNKGGYSSLNTSANTAPSWTATGTISVTVTSKLTLGFGTACSWGQITDFSGATVGSAPSVANLLSATFGAFGTTANPSGDGSGWVLNGDAVGGMTYAAAAYKASTLHPKLCFGGATYAEPSTQQGVSWNTSDTTASALQWNLPNSNQQLSGMMGMWFQTDIPDNDTGGSADIMAVDQTAGAQFSSVSFEPNQTCAPSHLALFLECCGGTILTDCFKIASGAWFYIAAYNHVGGTDRLRVYDTNGNTVLSNVGGIAEITGTDTGSGNTIQHFTCCAYEGGNGPPTAGHHFYFSKVKICAGPETGNTNTGCKWPDSVLP